MPPLSTNSSGWAGLDEEPLPSISPEPCDIGIGGSVNAEELRRLNHEQLLEELRVRAAADGTGAKEADAASTSPCGCGSPARPVRAAVPNRPDPRLADASSADIADALKAVQKVIYGVDDRLDVYQVSDAALRRDADGVVAIVNRSDITTNGDGTSTLNGETLGAAYGLCSTEPFRDQPTIAFCSGFLVDPSIVVTAAHCIDTADLADARFVFGYEMQDAGTAVTRITDGEIYTGRRILGRAIGTEGTDWCVVQLDRPVLNHGYLSVRRSGKTADGTAVHVIGHPSGLPKKVAGGAAVRDNSPNRYFVANLDTYGGNSGSPVYDSASHVVEGILVRGETDYVPVDGCQRSNVCPASGCRGEDVTRATEFAELVPANDHDFIPFDLGHAQVVEAGGRWKIEVDGMWLLDFADSKSEAEQALEVMQHYGFNTQCFVGRPQPSMEFYLVNGQGPQGSLAGEDVVEFDTDNVEVQLVGGRWKLVDGDHWILDFGTSQAEARQALSYVLRYRFRSICFVGRPDPSLTYFKR
jgi:trypsin-like peptidase